MFISSFTWSTWSALIKIYLFPVHIHIIIHNVTHSPSVTDWHWIIASTSPQRTAPLNVCYTDLSWITSKHIPLMKMDLSLSILSVLALKPIVFFFSFSYWEEANSLKLPSKVYTRLVLFSRGWHGHYCGLLHKPCLTNHINK